MARIRKARIKHISLVPRGANRMPVVFKSDDGSVLFDALTKADMEKGDITAVVYAPEFVDSQGDVADAEVIREMAHEFMKNGEGVDIRHDGNTLAKDTAFVAESFIIQKGDPRFADLRDYDGELVDATGGWGVVVHVADDSLRKAYRDGEWNGVSMGGTASKAPEPGSAIRKVGRAISGLFSGDSSMKIEDFKALLDEQTKAVVGAISSLSKSDAATASVAKEEPDKTEKRPEAPVFKGDFSNPNDILEHRKALAIHKARTECGADFDALKAEFDRIAREFKPSESEEVIELKAKLAKAQQRSNQSTETVDTDWGIGKDDMTLIAKAGEAAKRFYGGSNHQETRR